MTYHYRLYCEGEYAEFYLLRGENLADKIEEVLYILYAMEQVEDNIYEVDGDFYEVQVKEDKVIVTIMED